MRHAARFMVSNVGPHPHPRHSAANSEPKTGLSSIIDNPKYLQKYFDQPDTKSTTTISSSVTSTSYLLLRASLYP